MAGYDLIFTRPAAPVTGGPVDLVFGASSGVAPDTVELHGGGRITGMRGMAVLRFAVRAVGSGRITRLGGTARVHWDANVSRGTRIELQAAWQAAVPVASAMCVAWQAAAPLRVASNMVWQQGRTVAAVMRSHWQEALRLRAASRSHWQQGELRRSAVDVVWQETVRLRVASRGHWQQGELRRNALDVVWQETLRLRAASHGHWQNASPLRASVRTEYGDGQAVRSTLHTHWQEAMRPRSGRSDVAPPRRPPCYVPGVPVDLVFKSKSRSGLPLSLLFVCHRGGPDPRPPQYIIPLLRVYMTVHTISAVLLPSMEPVRFDSVTISSDDDGFCWHLAANGPEHLLEQLAPVGGLPARVRVTIDGIAWVFVVEPPERSRRFGEHRAQVRGSSLTALLGAPHMPEQSWTNSLALTAQQIVEKALEFTGVTVDWGLSDWLVPPNIWSHQGTPLSVALRVAESAGAVVRSHRTDTSIQFAPRYPHMPWSWPSATPNVQMPGQIITTDVLQHIGAPHYNAVYVAGTTHGGVLGHIVRAGSAGDVLAPQVIDALITHEVAARQRGSAILAAAAITKRQPITVPILTGGTNPGLILPGYLIEVVEPAETWRGLVRGITITAGMPTVRQTLNVERAI